MLRDKTIHNVVLSAITAAVLTACGGGGSCANCTTPGPNGGQLIFVAPSILPSLANKSGINYMGVYNPLDVTISGISYSMGQQVGSGNSITLDQTSAVNCASIAAKSSCFLKFSVPESTIAGGTVVTASNSDGTEAATPLAIGVQQVPYTESANANGVGLYFYSKAQYSESGVPFILVTAVVQSPNVGTINTIELVDESGNVIPDQVVTSNNSGPGNSPLQMGDVVEISLPIPQGVGITQNMKVRTSYQTLTTSALNSIADKLNLKNQSLKDSTNSSTGTTTYSLITQSNNINLQFTPNQVYLTQQNSIQYGYLYNIGDLTASQIEVSSSSPNVRVTAADEILNGQRVIKVTYELLNTGVTPTSNLVTVTAQNPSGQTQTSTGGTSQNVNPDVVPTPSPSPTPTPTPTPGPPPGPAPLLVSEQPANTAVGVASAPAISVTFDIAMNPATLIPVNFVLQTADGFTTISLSAPIVSSDGKTVTFSTAEPLAANTQYKIIIPNPANVKSATGTALNLPNDTYPGGLISTFDTANWSVLCDETQIAYVLNSDGSITACYENTGGGFSGCTNISVSGSNNPTSFFGSSGSSTAYIANTGANNLLSFYSGTLNPTFDPLPAATDLTGPTAGSVSSSSAAILVNNNGTLTSCTFDFGGGGVTGPCSVIAPTGLPTNSVYASSIPDDTLWLTNTTTNRVTACNVVFDSGTGVTTIPSCKDSGVGSIFNQPKGIYAQPGYVLVANSGNNTITRCDSNGSGTEISLSNCTLTGDGGFNIPTSISVDSYELDYIYITNTGDNSVSVCSNTNGNLTNCRRMSYGFIQPKDIFLSGCPA